MELTMPDLTHRERRTSALLVIAALALATSLAGCGESETTAKPTDTRTAANGDVYNAADVRFAQQMIPHHAQAIQMVDMTRGRDLSPEVEQLAAEILQTQTPEIEAMTQWLTAWEEEVPETGRDHANAHGDGMGDGGVGMMSEDEMDDLESSPPGDFEDMWLQMMVEHHEGAVEMALTEQEDGAFGPAIDLAGAIETGQSAEIELMEQLLDS
jgi:uncharacterized protein (DUF305 family)